MSYWKFRDFFHLSKWRILAWTDGFGLSSDRVAAGGKTSRRADALWWKLRTATCYLSSSLEGDKMIREAASGALSAIPVDTDMLRQKQRMQARGSPTGVVEMVALEGRTPILKDLLEPAVLDMPSDQVLRRVG